MGKVKRSKVKRSKVKRSKVKRSKVKRSKVRKKTNQSKMRTRRYFVKSKSRKYRTKKASRRNRRMRGGARQTTTTPHHRMTRAQMLAGMQVEPTADTMVSHGRDMPVYESTLPSAYRPSVGPGDPLVRAAKGVDFGLQARLRGATKTTWAEDYEAKRAEEFAAHKAKVLAEAAAKGRR